jgi:hypothetical protein
VNKMKLTAALVLGLSGLGCGTNDTDAPLTPDGLPALTAEEQAVADNMARNTLAEIELPEGKMVFVETAPGEVTILRKFAMGAKVTRVEGESGMTLEQLFRAYAPGRDVPQALTAAQARVAQREKQVLEGPALPAGQGEVFRGEAPAGAVEAPAGTEAVRSALASTSPQDWFTRDHCRVAGADWTWCLAVAYQGAYASRQTHRSNSVTCGDTGAARVYFYVGGTLRTTLDVPYGQCWYSGAYHHSHGFLGYNNETNQKYTIPYAQQTVRFAGWNADNDQFIGSF